MCVLFDFIWGRVRECFTFVFDEHSFSPHLTRPTGRDAQVALALPDNFFAVAVHQLGLHSKVGLAACANGPKAKDGHTVPGRLACVPTCVLLRARIRVALTPALCVWRLAAVSSSCLPFRFATRCPQLGICSRRRPQRTSAMPVGGTRMPFVMAPCTCRSSSGSGGDSDVCVCVCVCACARALALARSAGRVQFAVYWLTHKCLVRFLNIACVLGDGPLG